jgi:hypothetical protein
MNEPTNTAIKISVSLKARLEIKAAISGMNYRDYLSHLADIAVRDNPVSATKEPTKQTRINLNDTTKEKVKAFSKLAGCSQEQWLLSVFESATKD